MKTRMLKVLSLMLILSMLFPVVVMGNSPEPPEITPLESDVTITASAAQTAVDLDAARRTSDGRVGLIVELAAPPLALAPLARDPEFDLEGAASQRYLAALRQQQDALVAEMSAQLPSLRVDFYYGAAFNGFGVRIDPQDALALLQFEAVKRVYPDRMRTILLDSSTEVIHAPAFWNDLGGQGNAGEGIRVGIIDTGIRSENPMFDGTNYTQPPGFPRGYCADFPSDPDFQCNDKLITARYYTPTISLHPNEVYSPLDIHGHGSHVAGIAAGNPVDVPAGSVVPETTSISGVAPRAYLMVYKALFTQPDGNAGGSDAMLLAALNDALLDQVDVISNSWGGDDGGDPANSPYQTAVAALHAAGVVVVFAAGNGGPAPGTISCPGCLEDVITVGASTADRIFANTLDVTGPGTPPGNLLGLAALSGTGPEITGDIGGEIRYSGEVDPANTEGCSAFAGGAFSGSIALIPRGGCSFEIKVNNADAAGAVAVAIYNDQPGFPLVMALDTTSIPAVFLSKDNGEDLRDWVLGAGFPEARINVARQAVYNSYWQDAMWESSAAGPNGDPGVLKPDIIAPGVNLLSAASPALAPGEDYQFLQGTSTAAPHVTGAAALVVQQHVDWTPQQVKSALTSTSMQGLVQSDGSSGATPFMAGAGRLDLNQARNVGVTFDRTGFVSDLCSTQCVFQSGIIRNESLATEGWDAYVDAPGGMIVQVEPNSIFLAPGESRTFTVVADVSALATNQWHFASINWKHKTDAYAEAYLPLAMYVTEPDQASLEKVAQPIKAEPGDIIDYSLTLINDNPLTTTYVISDRVPANTSYVPGSATGGLVYDAGANELMGTKELTGVQMEVFSDTLHGYRSLAELGFLPMPCPDLACDDAALVMSGFDFIYNGRSVNELVWSTNGFLQMGADIPDLTTLNQELPNPAEPNNLLAPLWTDLDLDGGDGIGNGTWYYGFVTDGTFDYYVFEWENAGLKGDSTTQFTFQVWIKTGTDEIWFVYGPQTDAVDTATVGVENQHGSAGATYYYNGNGTAPVNGTTLRVLSSVDMAVFTYALEMGPLNGVDVINQAQVTNSRTGRVIRDSALVRIGERVYLPMLRR